MRLALLLAAGILGLGGCASTSNTDSAVRDDGLDRDRMSQVEAAAARSGARVHWVNPPLKPTR